MNIKYTYNVLEQAQKISKNSDLRILEVRKYLGIPLANDIRDWLAEKAPMQLLCIDFTNVQAITLSVAEELGPILLQSVQLNPSLEHRYPIYKVKNPEPLYTFARAFANFNLAGLAIANDRVDRDAYVYPVDIYGSDHIVMMGQRTKQMEQILELACRRKHENKELTSENLAELEFLAEVSPAARSKRLTDLYTRRLLAFYENPLKSKERLFIPAWSL